MKLKVTQKQVIEEIEWDKFVEDVYKRPYSFQQQDGCKERGTYDLTVPPDWCEDFKNDTVPENVNDPKRGVSLKAWLARDPKQKLSNPDDQASYCLEMWWQRNFYPTIEMLAKDLYEKGLLEAGEYMIDIDW